MLTMAMHRADAAIDPTPSSQMEKRHDQGPSDEGIHGQAEAGNGCGDAKTGNIAEFGNLEISFANWNRTWNGYFPKLIPNRLRSAHHVDVRRRRHVGIHGPLVVNVSAGHVDGPSEIELLHALNLCNLLGA